jgi:hypothetical protein
MTQKIEYFTAEKLIPSQIESLCEQTLISDYSLIWPYVLELDESLCEQAADRVEAIQFEKFVLLVKGLNPREGSTSLRPQKKGYFHEKGYTMSHASFAHLKKALEGSSDKNDKDKEGSLTI